MEFRLRLTSLAAVVLVDFFLSFGSSFDLAFLLQQAEYTPTRYRASAFACFCSYLSSLSH